MKIECLIKRRVQDPQTQKWTIGTEIELGKRRQRKYFFAPVDKDDPASPHVCEVEHPDDIGTLLAVKEGYRVFDPNAKAEVDEDDDTDADSTKNDDSKTADDDQGGGGGVQTYEQMSRGALRNMIKERTGKAPANNATNEKLVQILVGLDKEGK